MPQPEPTVLLLAGAASSPLGRHMFSMYAGEAHKRGVRLRITDDPQQAAAGPPPIPFGTVEPLDYTDPEQCASWAKTQVATGHRFEVIFSGREEAQLAVASAAEAIGAPGNPPEAVRTVRNKDLCRERLRLAGFRQPRLWLCDTVDDARRAIAEGAGPWIVKPRDASGSRGVTRVQGPQDVAAAVALVGDDRPFIVEEFVVGEEYSAEGLFVGGAPRVLGITAKEVTAPPHFFEIGHVLPAPLPQDAAKEITDQVSRALRTLGLRHGIFHVELWQSPEGVVLGEVHVRPGGDYIHLLLAYAIPDLEIFGTLIDDALGRPLRTPLDQLICRRAAAVRYLALPPGRVVSIDGWEDVAHHPATLHSELGITVGETVPPLSHSYDRSAAIVVGADTPQSAARLAADLMAHVRVKMEPTS